MKRTNESPTPVSADKIALLADQGKDVSHFFEGKGRMMPPIRKSSSEWYRSRIYKGT
ncbi:MAG: ribbon-helix-helix protein CopG family [Candidatus Solibacter sp.]|nr:ribbon-helix-helix protein CopG family [Candidatus Solibacter sp.]